MMSLIDLDFKVLLEMTSLDINEPGTLADTNGSTMLLTKLAFTQKCTILNPTFSAPPQTHISSQTLDEPPHNIPTKRLT